MSAANLIVASDCAHLISDALVWDTADNRVTAITSKVIMLPQFNAAVTVRARSFAVFHAIAAFLPTVRASGYDDFKSKIVDVVKQMAVELEAVLPDLAAFELSVAGFSETAGPEGFRITTLAVPIDTTEDIIRPFEIVEMPRGFNPSPCASAADENEIRSAIATAPANLEAHAIAALTAQRQIACRDLGAERAPCWVGGFAQLTTVTTSGISTRIIHRWPDVVGKKVAA